MQYKISLIFLLFLSFKINSQNLDSIFDAKKKVYKSLKTDKGRVDFLYDCGRYFYSKDIAKSEYCYSKALSILRHKKNTMEGKVLWKLGFIEKNKGNLGISFTYFSEAKKIFEDTNDMERFVSIHFDIGYLYRYKEQEDKELEYYKKGLLLIKGQKEIIKGKGYLHFGNYYTRQEKLDSSIYYYDKALDIFNRLNKENRIYNVYNNIANTYYKQGKYIKVIELRSKVLNYAKRQDKKLLLTINYHNIGTAYMKMGKYEIADSYLDSAIVVAKKEKLKVRLSKSYKTKASNDYNLKKYKDAFNNYKAHKIYSDSIFKSQSSYRIKEKELANKLEIEKKNLELLNQKQAYEKKLYIFIFSVFLLLSIPLVFLLYKNSVNKSRRIKMNLEKEKLKKEILLQKFNKSEIEIKNLVADNSMRLEFLKQLLLKLKEQRRLVESPEVKEYIKDLSFKIQQQITTESKLSLLKEKIDTVNGGFDHKLITVYGDLTKTEREVCALLRLNLSSKEIASIRNSSADAVKATRYRIRKKMNVPKNQKLESFIQDL